MKDIQARVLNVLSEQLGFAVAEIKLDHDMREHLNCDSLDCVEVMMGLEEEFGVDIDDDKFSKLNNVQEVIDHVADICLTKQVPAKDKMPNDNLAIAKRIANAASFFDTARATLAERDKIDAFAHTEHLHDIAKLLAGERCPSVYIPEDQGFLPNVAYESKIVIENELAPVRLSHVRCQDGAVLLEMAFNKSPYTSFLSPTPTECRALAIALHQLADDAEASAAQHRQEQAATQPTAAVPA